jgi:hypothetical protein
VQSDSRRELSDRKMRGGDSPRVAIPADSVTTFDLPSKIMLIQRSGCTLNVRQSASSLRHNRRKDYGAVVEDLDEYLKLDPASPTSAKARALRDSAQRALTESRNTAALNQSQP